MIIRTIFPGRILARISILPKISIGFGFVCVCRPIDDDIGSLGRTLEDFKADFKPDDLRLVASVFFLSKKSSIVWCHYDYLSAPDRDGASPNSIKHV